ncbi:MAG: L-rhamnose isomerase [Sphaerochaetaceae bacterium]
MKNEAYEGAKKAYAELSVDTDQVIEHLAQIPISLHCWQGDDVGGFERPDATLGGGGIQVTGNYPGKARSIAELRQDIEKVFSLVPGPHRLSLHASYGEFGGEFVDRDAIEPKHYNGWVEWAKKLGIGLDFNGTFFSHPLADDGYTLASKDPKVRKFWIEHAKRCRQIAAWIGQELGSTCILNTWVPDGAKDFTVDKIGYRRILKESLDEIFALSYPEEHMKDAIETKLFGIGSEAFVVGSHEFYMNYAARNAKMLCIDMGHFHTGEDVSDKLSSILLFQNEVLLHVSRPMRWDSDHVVLFNDDVTHVAQEIVRSGKLENVYIGLDFFDASINRVGAWATGERALRKALLYAMLEPHKRLLEAEQKGNGYLKMGLLEALKTLPFAAVWNRYCERFEAPNDLVVIDEVLAYEEKILKGRN